jgi:hypothetical protein
MQAPADLTLKNVEAPPGRLCASGHHAPLMIGKKVMRWFLVTEKEGKGKVYCEACMRVANHAKKLKKEQPEKWQAFALANGLTP